MYQCLHTDYISQSEIEFCTLWHNAESDEHSAESDSMPTNTVQSHQMKYSKNPRLTNTAQNFAFASPIARESNT